jgi:hypothetical protein
MRMTTILAAGVTLAFAMAANAQETATPPAAQPPAAQPPAAQPPAAAPGAEAATPSLKGVNIIDVAELTEATQKQVNEVVAQQGEDNLQKLRQQIDATPQIKSALEAKGLTSAQVIVASMSPEGVLTLVTKKEG